MCIKNCEGCVVLTQMKEIALNPSVTSVVCNGEIVELQREETSYKKPGRLITTKITERTPIDGKMFP